MPAERPLYDQSAESIAADPVGLASALQELRRDFDAHMHTGSDSRRLENLYVDNLVASNSILSINSLAVVKQSFSDTTAGFWVGVEGGVAKLNLGNASQFLKWTGTALSMSGSITASSGTIGGWTIGSTTLTGGGVTLDSAGTITGGTIRTSSSGQRVTMNGSTNELQFHRSSGALVGTIFGTTSGGVSAIAVVDSASVVAISVTSTGVAIGNGNLTIGGTGSLVVNNSGLMGFSSAYFERPASGQMTIHGDLSPDIDLAWVLGDAAAAWNEIYVDKVLGNGGGNVIDLAAHTTEIVTNQTFSPSSAAGANLGNATRYWNDVSYKTLTDRGCLGWFDEGVEMQDGRVVSDVQALLEIKKDPQKTTVYGKPMLDYSSLPKAVYKPVDREKEPNGVEGAETTALISIMLGAIKELGVDVAALKKAVNLLP